VKPSEQYPSEGTTIYFHSALLGARTIDKVRKVAGSSSHRTQFTKVEDGYLYIDKDWSKKQK